MVSSSPRGNQGFLAFSFGDILNTFNLDFLLSAAETDGLLRIVSTPRVTTQNLQQASIRSGLQIPVQTVANNTVTVQYVDATLRLQVTPQITAEGTVNLEIDIKKQEAVLAAAVVGGEQRTDLHPRRPDPASGPRRRYHRHRRHLPDQRPGKRKPDPRSLQDSDLRESVQEQGNLQAAR